MTGRSGKNAAIPARSDGGYADYCVLPAHNLVPIPAALPYDERPEEVAVICDAIVTPVKVSHYARIEPLDQVAVIGAGGGVGIHMVQLAKLRQARVIAVDIVSSKLDLARKVGADETLNAAEVPIADGLRTLGGKDGLDVVIDFVGTPATLTAGLGALGRAGRLVTMAGQALPHVPIDMASLRSREIEIMGSRYASKEHIVEGLNLVAAGLVKPIVTVTASLEEAEQVHAALEAGTIAGRAAIVL